MRGIVGYTGTQPAAQALADALKHLECDAASTAGCAVEQDGRFQVMRCANSAEKPAEATSPLGAGGTCGIGHASWATNGAPDAGSASSQELCAAVVAVALDGTVENAAELRQKLVMRGHTFAGYTGAEVVAHLVEEAYVDDLLQAVRTACKRLMGSFALVVASGREPGVLVAARQDLPLVVGRNAEGAYAASDPRALSDVLHEVVELGEGMFAKLTVTESYYFTTQGEELYEPETTPVA